ncbi:site-2 protease family protein [Aeoliella sp. SH292]|uniref:site-2 protease family protein n=1 Tax=Aeoliella sp. SH292 TaxID=3454464 RepID=UPI003F969F67
MCVNVATASLLTSVSVLGETSTNWLPIVLAILAAAAGLGFIIFVHELGHFMVAKWCGVKCDKFMIGFDIGGYKVGKQIGETYYGIGILPLGGYVRMLGQNDDPRMNEEQIRESEASVGQAGVETKEIIGPRGEKHLVDARSYIAKSVPQRMAIISAGVIMNVIFAFIFAVIAFRVGVPSMPSIVSATDPGGPAWEAGWQAGDQIVQIDDIKNPWYDQLQQSVVLSGRDEPVTFVVKKADSGETITTEIQPSRERQKIAQVGVQSPISLKLSDDEPTVKFAPANSVKDKIPAGSTIVAVDGTKVASWREFEALLAAKADQPIELTLQPKSEKDKTAEPVTVQIDANPTEYVGMVMKMGPIVGVQLNSPAAKAGLKEGDVITAINDKPIGMDGDTVGWDPLTLGDELGKLGRTGETVTLSVERSEEGKPTSLTLPVELREANWIEAPLSDKSPLSIPAMGVAYYLTNEVVGALPSSPAAAADLKAGDQVVSAKLVVDEKFKDEYQSSDKPLEINAEMPAMASLFKHGLQNTPPGTKLELEVMRGDAKEPIKVAIDIASSDSQFEPKRGLALTPVLETRRGETLGEQMSMGLTETGRALTSVYRFLQRLVTNDIPVGALGGPITIARASYMQALEGPGKFLLFLTLISANLAVVNFLPIPVLDGGHMVFLAYEGIFRRPANEYFAGVLNLAGLALIVCLMVFVFGLDLGLINRNL